MEINRWRRFGKDRLYVVDDEGSPIGWWDLVTDAAHPERDEFLAVLTEAAAGWRAAAPATAASTEQPVPAAIEAEENVESSDGESVGPEVVSDEAEPDDQTTPAPRDLLANAAGQQLADQIQAAHAAGQRPTLLRRFFLGKNAYSSWERGAIGERLVAEELAKLVRKDPRWGYIHSIPVGTNGSDIDHLVIGPGGVFALNAKYHKGAKVWVGGDTVMVNGARQPYVRNSRFEAKRVSRLLSDATGLDVEANGIVVPVGASDFTVKAQPDDIRVVNRARLVAFLLGVPDLLPRETVMELFEHARLAKTWV